MKHELKIWPQYYARVADGSKTFEVRDNDRGFQPGDTVELREWDPTREMHEVEHNDWTPMSCATVTVEERVRGYTKSPALTFRVGYVLPLDGRQVVFSLLKQ